MAAQEGVHAGVEEEAQEDLARLAQHHDKGHQRTPRAADLQMTEVAPVHLRLLSGQRAQAQVGLGAGARPHGRHEVAEVRGRAHVAPLDHHGV